MAQASVHRTAVIEGNVTLAEGVTVGPFCVILGTCGPVTIGAGTTLVSHAHVNGPISIGERNAVYPNACLGFGPQDLGFDQQSGGAGTTIGNDNIFREGVTVHRAKTLEPTQIGNRNFFMTNSHVGHDTVVCDHCIFASGALLGGHVHVADRAVVSGNSTVHQFCRLGRGSMITGGAGAAMDVPPWFMVTAINLAGSLNVVGMRRNGLTLAQIRSVRWVYKTIYRSGVAPQQALPVLEERADDPVVAEYIAFIRTSKRGICHGEGRSTRGTNVRTTAPLEAEP